MPPQKKTIIFLRQQLCPRLLWKVQTNLVVEKLIARTYTGGSTTSLEALSSLIEELYVSSSNTSVYQLDQKERRMHASTCEQRHGYRKTLSPSSHFRLKRCLTNFVTLAYVVMVP